VLALVEYSMTSSFDILPFLSAAVRLLQVILEVEKQNHFWSPFKSPFGLTSYDSLKIKSEIDNYERVFGCNRPCKIGSLQSDCDAARGIQLGITILHGSLGTSRIRHVDVGTGTRTDGSPERQRDLTARLILPMSRPVLRTAIQIKEVLTHIPSEAEKITDTIRQFQEVSREYSPVNNCAGPIIALQKPSWPLESHVLRCLLGWSPHSLTRLISSMIGHSPRLLVCV